MNPLVQDPIAEIVYSVIPAEGISWKGLYEATGKPPMSTLSYAVRSLERAGKVERIKVQFARRQGVHEDRWKVAKVLIRRRA